MLVWRWSNTDISAEAEVKQPLHCGCFGVVSCKEWEKRMRPETEQSKSPATAQFEQKGKNAACINTQNAAVRNQRWLVQPKRSLSLFDFCLLFLFDNNTSKQSCIIVCFQCTFPRKSMCFLPKNITKLCCAAARRKSFERPFASFLFFSPLFFFIPSRPFG